MFRRFVFALTLSLPVLAQDPIAPHSAFEPPAAKAAASLAASTKASPPDLLTTGEKSDWNETAPVRRSRRDLAPIGEGLALRQGARYRHDARRPHHDRAGRQSKDRAFTPEAAAKTSKVVIFIQSGIHAGEIEGKDTVLMLVRDMVVGKKFASWLDHAIFVIIPVFNVDGHEYFCPTIGPARTDPIHRTARQRAAPQSESRLHQGRHAGDARLAQTLQRVEPRFPHR